MQVLLDTHLLLWAVGDPDRLDPALVQLLEDPMNTPVFSVVNLWEVVIKSALDRPDFRVEPFCCARFWLRRAGVSWWWRRATCWLWRSCPRCIATPSIVCCWRRRRPMVCC